MAGFYNRIVKLVYASADHKVDKRHAEGCVRDENRHKAKRQFDSAKENQERDAHDHFGQNHRQKACRLDVVLSTEFVPSDSDRGKRSQNRRDQRRNDRYKDAVPQGRPQIA